jgi:hypothetical protein
LEGLFNSYFPGGFECSTDRWRDGRRLELIAATGHDRAVVLDYRTMLDHNPGWTNLRHCEVDLLRPLDERGRRPICLPLAEELRRQQALFDDLSGAKRGEPAAVTAPSPRVASRSGG